MAVAQRSIESRRQLAARLSDAALLTLGYWLAGGDRAQVPAYAIVLALEEFDLVSGDARRELARRIVDAAERADFAVLDGFVVPRNPRAARQRAVALWNKGREETVEPVAETPTPTPTPVSRVTTRAAPAAAGPSPATSASPPAPVPPAPALAPPPVTVAPLDEALIGRLLSQPGSSGLAVSLALRSHALATAAQFQDLVGIGTLKNLDSHAYQTETVRRVLRVLHGRALLADEVGLGKTIEALMVLREYELRGMAKRVLVLAPPALARHWVGELADRAGIVAQTTEDGRLREDADAFWGQPGVIVASLALARGARHAPLVQGQSWDLVIVDEAHHVKNRQTAGWKLVNGIRSRFLLLLTATPVETDLEEIYNLVTLLKPGQLTTPAEFRRNFVDPADPTAPRDADRLRRLLADVMVRNTRAQSGLALPPRYVTTVAVEPADGEREVYEAVVELLRRHATDPKARLATTTLLLEAGSSPAAVRATLQRMADGDKHTAALREGAARLAELASRVPGSRKLEALLEVARQSDRVLVFTRFRETLEYVVDGVRRDGLEPAVFHGGMRADERHQQIERFRAGQARVLVATDVGGEGQNLQFCQTLVNFDLPWNPMLIEQRIGRLHRMGQTGEVRVYNLCAGGTAEQRVLEVLDGRLHLFELVVGEMDMVLGNLADDRDLEERIVELYAASADDGQIAEGFERIAQELGAARGRYERVRALDETLFKQDFEA
jgi:superfamily II DNA or RNA helicase